MNTNIYLLNWKRNKIVLIIIPIIRKFANPFGSHAKPEFLKTAPYPSMVKKPILTYRSFPVSEKNNGSNIDKR